MPTYDVLEPRTNKSVYAFAAAIRDQLAAMLRSDFLAGQGFTRFQLWQTPSSIAGGGGMFFGDTTGAMWDLRVDASGDLHLDRFLSGAWHADTLRFEKATGALAIGGETTINTSQVVNSQLRITSAGQGSFSVLNYAAGNVGIGFDTDWTGSAFIARHASVASLRKLAGQLVWETSGGNTIGAAVPLHTRMSLNCSTGQFLIGEGQQNAYAWETASVGRLFGQTTAALGIRNGDHALIAKVLAGASRAYLDAVDSVTGLPNELAVQPSGGSFSIGSAAPSFGGGERVVFLADRATAPTTNPSGGGLLYSEGGAAKWRGSSGTVTTFGPADPHCPQCGADYGTERYNPKYGYVWICEFCLADELGDRPYIVRVQTDEQGERVKKKNAAEITEAKDARLAEAAALIATGKKGGRQ